MTKRFVVNAVTQCTTLLGNNFGKEKLCLILSFLSIESTSQYKLKETLSSSISGSSSSSIIISINSTVTVLHVHAVLSSTNM